MLVFVSQPMRGLTEEQILDVRNKAMEQVRAKYPDQKIDVVGYIPLGDAPEGAGKVWYLGRSVAFLDNVDLAVFISGWETAHGCKVEHLVCEEYGIEMMEVEV